MGEMLNLCQEDNNEALPFHTGKMMKWWETRAWPEVSFRCRFPPGFYHGPVIPHP